MGDHYRHRQADLLGLRGCDPYGPRVARLPGGGNNPNGACGLAYFTLFVVASRDGFIGRDASITPAVWASAEEQARFVAGIAGLDWAFMGRTTHELAYNSKRRRCVFSSTALEPFWRGTHLWVDPRSLPLAEMLRRLASVHPVGRCGILGGTRVHDWFLAQGRIDAVELSVEPLDFGAGLPIFADQDERDPVRAFERRGFAVLDAFALNAGGTRHYRLALAQQQS